MFVVPIVLPLDLGGASVGGGTFESPGVGLIYGPEEDEETFEACEDAESVFAACADPYEAAADTGDGGSTGNATFDSPAVLSVLSHEAPVAFSATAPAATFSACREAPEPAADTGDGGSTGNATFDSPAPPGTFSAAPEGFTFDGDGDDGTFSGCAAD